MDEPGLYGLCFRFLGYAVLFHFASRWSADEEHRPNVVKSVLFALARIALGALLLMAVEACEKHWLRSLAQYQDDFIFGARLLAWGILLWFACHRKLLPLAAILFCAFIFHFLADYLFPPDLFHGLRVFV